MAAISPASSFEGAIAVTPLSSHTYSADLREEWCIGTVPHGGYITALFHTLARTHLNHTHPRQHGGSPDPFTLHLTFLRRTSVGPAKFRVQDSKLGARTSTLHITLSQIEGGEERDEVVAYVTCTNLGAEEGVSAKTDWAIHPPALSRDGNTQTPVSLTKLASHGTDGIWKLFEVAFASFRKASTHIEVFVPRLDGSTPVGGLEGNGGEWKERRGIVEQWARFAPYGKVGRWNDASIGYLIDMFPMMLEGFDKLSPPSVDKDGAVKKANARFWYPTVLLNVDIKKKLPPGGVEWLYTRVQTKAIKDGRMDLDIIVLDEAGEVVALSNQVALVVSASRNSAARGRNARAKVAGDGGSKI